MCSYHNVLLIHDTVIIPISYNCLTLPPPPFFSTSVLTYPDNAIVVGSRRGMHPSLHQHYLLCVVYLSLSLPVLAMKFTPASILLLALAVLGPGTSGKCAIPGIPARTQFTHFYYIFFATKS